MQGELSICPTSRRLIGKLLIHRFPFRAAWARGRGEISPSRPSAHHGAQSKSSAMRVAQRNSPRCGLDRASHREMLALHIHITTTLATNLAILCQPPIRFESRALLPCERG